MNELSPTPETLDLRAPSPNHKFLDHFTGHGEPAGLWPSRAAALVAYFGQGTQVGTWEPHAFDLPADLTWKVLPRDPEEFLACSLAGLQGFYASNPNPIDGYFLPDELYASLLRHALAQPGLRVLSDESLFAYRHEPMPCGTGSHLFASGRVGLICALEDWDSRRGAVLWGVEPLSPPPAISGLDERSAGALRALQRRDFQGSLDLLRWTTVAGRAMRAFTEKLRPAIDAGCLSIAHWPRAGHRILVTGRSPFQGELFLKRLATEARVLALPGALAGAPDAVILDLAHPVAVAREAGERLARLVTGS